MENRTTKPRVQSKGKSAAEPAAAPLKSKVESAAAAPAAALDDYCCSKFRRRSAIVAYSTAPAANSLLIQSPKSPTVHWFAAIDCHSHCRRPVDQPTNSSPSRPTPVIKPNNNLKNIDKINQGRQPQFYFAFTTLYVYLYKSKA